jgi:hypothetical protein
MYILKIIILAIVVAAEVNLNKKVRFKKLDSGR